jgi:ribosome maturation factor RimP
MTKTPLSEKLAGIIAPAVATLDLQFWGVEIASAGSRMLLRVYIDALGTEEGGVTVANCVRVSRHLGALFDAEDVIPGAYVLEVSSPGLERRFFSAAQLAAYVGQVVDVRLTHPQDGRRHLRGVLSGVEGEDLVIAEEKETVRVHWERVKGAHLVHDFPAATQPGT